MGHAYEVVSEFTWDRVNTNNANHASWTYEIIDVVGSKNTLTMLFTDRPIPPWLLDNAEFQRVADDCFDVWFAHRDSGFSLPISSLPLQHVKGWS